MYARHQDNPRTKPPDSQENLVLACMAQPGTLGFDLDPIRPQEEATPQGGATAYHPATIIRRVRFSVSQCISVSVPSPQTAPSFILRPNLRGLIGGGCWPAHWRVFKGEVGWWAGLGTELGWGLVNII